MAEPEYLSLYPSEVAKASAWEWRRAMLLNRKVTLRGFNWHVIEASNELNSASGRVEARFKLRKTL